MSDSQTSCVWQVKADSTDSTSASKEMKIIEDYFSARIDEIDKALSDGKRSIFDFVDMAVVIGALANMTDTCANNSDTDQYIDFVKSELIAASESHADVVATAFYCLMRCGLVHEMSLGGHKIMPVRQHVVNGYSISITHDKSSDSNWYFIDASVKEIVFYAHELLSAIKACIAKCFNGTSNLFTIIRGKVQSSNGIKIIVQADRRESSND